MPCRRFFGIVPAMSLEKCANCDVTIGKLETPHVWGDAVVCAACYGRLDVGRGSTETLTESDLVADLPERPPLFLQYGTPRRDLDDTPVARAAPYVPPGAIICPNPNCGYVGTPKRKSKGSAVIMIVLLLLWVIPGVIYAIVYNGYTLTCPRCGIKVRDE